ncbi:MAG: hypothetical protein IH965_07590 [Gemmatimonadetes bacterium]|nr:hypothetical protein [Gemmatimonadota bacterium]
MTGADLYNQVRAAGLDTKFIFASGYAQDCEMARPVVESGAPFSDKPRVPADLVGSGRYSTADGGRSRLSGVWDRG